MGLYIRSASDKEYSFSYSGLHAIRYMAYKTQDGKSDYGEWQKMQDQSIQPDWAYALCLLFYPNLMWHSDCDGTYTLRGKIDLEKGILHTGNSKQLLWELNDIKEMLTKEPDASLSEHDWARFNALRDLVDDCVTNYNGRIEFC